MTTCAVCWESKELTLFQGDLWCTECQEQYHAERLGDAPSPTASTEAVSEETPECPLCCQSDVELVVAHETDDGHLHGLACQPCQDALLNSYSPKCTTCNASLTQTPEQERMGWRAYDETIRHIWEPDLEENVPAPDDISDEQFEREVQENQQEQLREYLRETASLRPMMQGMLIFALNRRSEVTSAERLKELFTQHSPHQGHIFSLERCQKVYDRVRYLERPSEQLLFDHGRLFILWQDRETTPLYHHLYDEVMNIIEARLQSRGVEMPDYPPAAASLTRRHRARANWIASLWYVQ